MFKEFKGLNLPQIDKEILEYWDNAQIFQKSIDQRDSNQPFVFYEGPPSANGMPGIHHVMARAIKDIFCRFQTMKGKRVERKGGWDTHGLPIELSVEKELGITKEDIGKSISVEEYNDKCRETVMRYKDKWDAITKQMGYWVDLENPYVTYTNEYIESVWWLISQLYQKGLLYKGYTIQPYSPAAGTGLSSHELNMPNAYQEITDISAVAQFKVKGEVNTFILAWTTTPWTLPSNTALAVGKDIRYVKVHTFNRYTKEECFVILAKDRFSSYFSEQQPDLQPDQMKAGNQPIPYIEIVGEYTGRELEGIHYEQLLSYVIPEGKAFEVILGDFVTTSDGTGIVHISPTFGADDFKVAKLNGIAALTVPDVNGNPMPLVDKQGKFVSQVTDFAGRYVKDYGQKEERSVDTDITIKLKTENKLFVSEKYVHSYPHCWRTDKPILYYPLDSWFIKTSSLKERMVQLNQTINWKPASTGEGRFGKWLENLQDWNLSRSRYWGIPLPIWRSTDAKEEICIQSIAQLKMEIDRANDVLGLQQSVPADLHRPYMDEIILVSANGEKLFRELDLIDVWFDSGAMPYAQWHYPFENKEKFEQNFPADFIAEGVDQTRGWFYTLHAIGVMVFDSVAFKNVVSNGLVLDKNGQKMSKRLGNGIDPFSTIEKYGADATRWYMISNAQPWDNLKFDLSGIEEVSRKFFGTLYNTYSFFALYANIDQFKWSSAEVPLEKRPEIDRWVLSELNTLIHLVDTDYATYEPTNATRKIMEFVDENLSNWYVRLCRRRFWKGEMSEDKLAAYQTLYTCLNVVSRLMAPVAPFFADWLYRNLQEGALEKGPESVHLALIPVSDSGIIDHALEERMAYAQRISSLVLSLRKKEKLKVRQPLQKMLIPILNDDFEKQVDGVKDLILAEVNVKEIEYVSGAGNIIQKKVKPDFKSLGKKLGKNMKAVADALASLSQEDIQQIEKSGSFETNISGEIIQLTKEELEIVPVDIPGWLVATDAGLTVALDIQLSDELVAEGMARELVNRIQNIRKSSDFNVTDKIAIQLEALDFVKPAVEKYASDICSETLAEKLDVVEKGDGGEILDLPEGEIWIKVTLS
ncbi:MAG: isoleucine--tRNA ligase [Bacteroidota bacterium]